MLQQRIQAEQPQPFPGDDPANRAVTAVCSRVAEYAELTRRLATGQFTTNAAREDLRKIVIEKRDLIISRARSGGVVEHEMDTFWEAAIAHAAQLTKRRIEIFDIPARHEQKPIVEPEPEPVTAQKAKRPRKLRSHRA